MSDTRRAVARRLRSADERGATPRPDEPDEFDPDSLGPDTPAHVYRIYRVYRGFSADGAPEGGGGDRTEVPEP